MITVILGSWGGVACILLALALLALMVAVGQWHVLRGHSRKIDVQGSRPGALTNIIMAHLPKELRTNIASEEIPRLKEAIGRKSRRYQRAALAAGIIAIVLAPAAWIATNRMLKNAEARRIEALLPPKVDVLNVASGTWGWKYDALVSCAANPHKINLFDDRHRMSIRFATPVESKSNEGQDYEAEVIGVRRNELVLSLLPPLNQKDQFGRPVEWTFVFRNPNTYYIKRSDAPVKSTGDIVRCPK
jgi:hypothetical protein